MTANLYQCWRDAISVGEDALARSNWLELLDAVNTAYELRPELDALDPLVVMAEQGTTAVLEIAECLDPGRCWLWQLLIAVELVAQDNLELARQVLIRVCAKRPRLPHNAVPLISTLLPGLYRLDPELPLKLAAIRVHVNDSLMLLGACGEDELVLDVSRLLEQSDALPRWDEYMVQGAAQAERDDLVNAIVRLFERTYPDTGTMQPGRMRTPESRRLQAWRRIDVPGTSRFEKASALIDELLDQDKTPLDRAVEAMQQGNGEDARKLLEKGLDRIKKTRGTARLSLMSRAVQVHAALGEHDAALKLLSKMKSSSRRTQKADTLARMETSIAIAEITLGEIPSGLARLLKAASEFDDHDDANWAIGDAVDAAILTGQLETLCDILPAEDPDHDDVFYRNQLVKAMALACAADGQIDKAFTLIDLISDRIDKDSALESLLVQFLPNYSNDLEVAERAALGMGGSKTASRLVDVAIAWHKDGNQPRARYLFEQALAAATDNRRVLGDVTQTAFQYGYVDGLPRAISSGLNQVLEEEPEAWQRWCKANVEKGLWWLNEGTIPNQWGLSFLQEPLEPPHPSWAEKIRGLARRSRLLRPTDRAEAEALFNTALELWQQKGDRPWEQFDDVSELARASGPAWAERLMPRIQELIEHARGMIQDGTRATWYQKLSWSLAFLEEWDLSLEVACEIAMPLERLRALEVWIVAAPLSSWCGHLEMLLHDEPMRGYLLAKLGQFDSTAKERAIAMLAP